MRRWLLVCVLGCGSSHHGKPDAPIPSDVPIVDAAVDASIDAAPDASPDAGPVPTCATPPTILVDTTPRLISGIANVGNVLYVSAYNPNLSSDVAVLAFDPGTGASIGTPLVPAAGTLLSQTDDAAYAAEGRDGGSIWRLVPGQSPVELVTGRPTPTIATSDGTYVYWSEKNPTAGQPEIIRRRLIAGGPVEHVMDGCAGPARIVVDASDLYCMEFTNGEVLRAPKDGSAAATGVPYGGHVGEGYPAVALVQEGANLHIANFYNNPEVWSAVKPNGPFQLVTESPDLGRYLGLAVTPGDFYVTNQEGYVERIDRTTHSVQKIEIMNMTTYGGPDRDPIVWNGQLLVVAQAYTTAGDRYVLHCID